MERWTHEMTYEDHSFKFMEKGAFSPIGKHYTASIFE